MRIGTGYDVHALVKGRKLILGGVEIEWPKGLAGHSDADVLVHAICDACLGAAGLGDIGIHFPPEDENSRISTVGNYSGKSQTDCVRTTGESVISTAPSLPRNPNFVLISHP